LKIKAILGIAAEKAGYSVITSESLAAMRQRLSEAEESKYAMQLLGLLQSMHVSDVDRFVKFGKLSNAQLLQDLFVLELFKFKRNGYFVEFGAADGIRHSNSYLLEKEFAWAGILAEPATIWHNKLYSSRSAKIDTRCVWSESNKILEFSEDLSAELSSPTEYRNQGIHENRRIDTRSYQVVTISLRELLIENEAPKVIDYLSIDTEGSEYRILNAFDWSEFKFQVISVEHNFSKDRELIAELLASVGYRQVYPELSKFDDWYIHEDMSNS
jgi:FkbM family methyltransferase